MDAPRKFYRDKFGGKLMGVCAGCGDYFGIDPLWLRLGFVVTFFVSSGLVVPVYLLIVLITPAKPPHMYSDTLTRTFGGERDVQPTTRPEPATRMGNEQ